MLLVLAVLAFVIAGVALAHALDLLPASRPEVRARFVVEAVPDGPTGGLGGSVPGLGLRRAWITPSALKKMEANLSTAGKPADLLPKLLTIKLVAPIVVALVAWMYVSGSDSPFVWAIALLAVATAYGYPDIYLNSRAVERRSEIERTLPDLLDQVTIALDAGMSFEAAFARVGATHRGPLGPEITRTLQDMGVGLSRRAAYEAMAERNDVDDLHRFVKSLVQAEEFGVPLSQVVRLLGEEMRDKRRQRASAKAQTVPLKLLFPMMTCLLPVLFIVMLTPAVMNLGKVL